VIGPTGDGDSPYQSVTTFGGNPLLVSLERLAADGLLGAGDLLGDFPSGRVDFGAVAPFRRERLRRAWEAFRAGRGPRDLRASRPSASGKRGGSTTSRCTSRSRRRRGGASWMDWPEELARRRGDALAACRAELAESVERSVFEQFLFFEHWGRVHAKASELGVEILGDLPIFVAGDSADVWAHQDLFDLDQRGRPRVVASVPPDYFSATGQLWGNPLYQWDVHRERGFDWWIDRVRSSLATCDRLRIDHFRAFEDYWEIPAGEETAMNGHWVAGPRDDFFVALREALGDLPIVAEDLGDVTQAVFVFDLRDRFDLPGMRVMQFGFADDSGTNPHSPATYPEHCVAYTGTHDNDTVRGWFDGGEATTMDAEAKEAQRARPARHRDGRLRHPLGPNPAPLRVRGGHGGRPDAGPARARHGGAHERARACGRQLGLAAPGRAARRRGDRAARGADGGVGALAAAPFFEVSRSSIMTAARRPGGGSRPRRAAARRCPVVPSPRPLVPLSVLGILLPPGTAASTTTCSRTTPPGTTSRT
jgi:4-alpha-glucanotransferase